MKLSLLSSLLAFSAAIPCLGQSAAITEISFPGASETRVLDMDSNAHVVVGTFTLSGSLATHAFIRWSNGQYQELVGGGQDVSAVALCLKYANAANPYYTVGGSITGPGANDAAAVMWFPPSADGPTYVTDSRSATPHFAGAAVTVVTDSFDGYGVYAPQGPSFILRGASVWTDIATPGSFVVTAAYPLIVGNVLNPPGFPTGATVAARWSSTNGLTIVGPSGHESRAWSAGGNNLMAGTIDDQAAIWPLDQPGQIIPGTTGTTGRVCISNEGYVVGQGSDFIYYRGTTYRLMDLVPSASGWTTITPAAINAHQYIAGSGTLNGQVRGFIMRTCFVEALNTPNDWTTCTNFPISLPASAAGPGPFTYQWRKDSQPLSDAPGHISGAHSADLNIVHTALTDAGVYDCIVTNNCQSEVSGTWTISVVPGPCCYCPADFNNDGDIGTDADIEAFFSCLGGSCCDSCCTVDVNQDGDLGTDADIDDFFRILAGEPCGP